MEDFRINSSGEDDLIKDLSKRKNRFVILPKELKKPAKSKDQAFLQAEEEAQQEGDSDDQFVISENDDYQVILYDQNLPNAQTAVPVSQEEVSGDFRFTSMLGTPLVMPVKIDGYQLPNEPLITITGSKKIVRTALNGSNSANRVQHRGSVKELISVDDYQIKISGRLLNEPIIGKNNSLREALNGLSHYPNAYPSQEMRRLIQIFEARKTLKIESALTQLFGIENIAISKVSFPGEAGMHNSQRYEITGYSDEDFEIDQISQA